MKKAFRKALSILLVAVMLVSSAPLAGLVGLDLPDWLDFSKLFEVEAEASTSGTCGENITWIFDEATGELVISGTGEMVNYTSTTSAPWSTNSRYIRTVEITNGITTIGDYAFSELYFCISILIPESVTYIGDSAFRHCESLTNITLPGCVTHIGGGAFYHCENLINIVIPDSVTHIGDFIFYCCDKLENVTIGNGITSIGRYAFAWCNSIKNISIPDSVISIGYYAFNGCESLTDVNLGNSVITINNQAFSNCPNLRSITIPDSVETIGNAFLNCDSLTGINIPSNVKDISSSAFKDCDSLSEIIVDGDNEYYSNDAYGVLFNKDKTKLIQYPIGNNRTSYTVHALVHSIDSGAFYGCKNLTSILVDEDNSYYSNDNYGVLYCTNWWNEKYLFQYPIGNTRKSYTIPDDVEYIRNSSFEGCEGLSSVIISDSVVSIGDYAFRFCNTLSYVTMGENLTGIGAEAFRGCENITELMLPNSITSIGTRAFYGCNSLVNVTIPNGVTQIHEGTFMGCKSLESIVIPDSVTSIGDSAFYECTSLLSVIIPDSVTEIGDRIFYNCTGLTSVIIGNGITELDSKTLFVGCYNLASITIGSGVADKSLYIFDDCVALEYIWVDGSNSNYSSDQFGVLYNKEKTKLIIYPKGNSRADYVVPDSVTTIGNSAFKFSNLTSIYIPNSVTSINKYAFSDCNSLLDVYYAGSEEKWNNISIGYGNTCLINATIHFNSEMPKNPNKVTGVDIPQTKIQMTDSAMLMEATVYPETAENKEIIWTSSNPTVADFYGDDGVLVAYNNGYTVVTATTVDGAYSDSCIVFVGESSMTLRSNDSFDVPIGQMNEFNVTLVDLESISLTETGEVSIDKLSDKSLSEITAVVANADVAIIDSLEVSDSAFKMKVKGVTVGTTYVTLTNTETGEVIYFPIDVFDGEAVYTYDTIPQTVIENRGVSNFRKNGMNIYDFECEENADGSSNVSFNVYNVSWNIGVVEVFDENGTRINTYSVSAFDNNDLTSVKDNVERFGVLVTNIFKAKNFDDVFDITTSVGSAHTPINTVVPKNGYIRITNDISASDACLIYNMVDISVKVISAIESIDLGNKSKQVTDTVAKTITEEIADSFEGSTSSFFKKLILEINKASSFNDYKMFIEYFESFLNSEDIDFNEIFMEVISDVLYDVAEDLALKSLGTYGEIVSSFYSFNGKVKIMHMLEDCQDFEGTGSAYIYDNQTGDQRVSNGIVFNGNIGSETIFRTYSVTYGGLYDNLTDENGEENTRVYEISMVKNGECVQPESKVQVRIPIPDSWVGDKITVYRVTDNNECINMNAHRDGDYMVFETDHFSYYALVNEFELIASIRPPSTTTISYGDSIILHADMNKALPDGWRIEWSADNGKFGYSISTDGTTCTITPSKSGDTTFTATVYDAEGNEICKDEQTMTSKAGFFQKLAAFFKKLFGLTKTYPEAFKGTY